jgi:cyclopropane-fatty-acyl-phospholipid synthase
MNAPDPTEIPAALAESSPIPAPAISRVIAAIGSRTNVCFRIFFANGASYQNHDGMPAVSVTFNTRGAELRTILFGHVGLLEAYFDGSVDIDGDIALVFRAGLDAGFDLQPNALVAVRNRWHEWRFSNRSPAQARANARFHYGLGRAFYEQWLDRNALVYTCGYWREGTKTIEEAQRNKMDHVCRKVQLSRGDSFVDIGCGWGGLLFHAWEHYGARGTGINNTTEQVNELRDDIARRGLHEQVRVIEADFRNVTEQYDKLLSIGTLEHAGRDQLFDVVRAHAQCLKPGGLGLIHFIGHVGSFDTDFYIRKHIFPGGWIPSLSQALDAMERSGLEIVDVENLRRHYALTLDAWAESFDQRWSAIHALDPARFDERFRRKWRTYLWACAEMFRSQNSRTHLFQITVSKGNIGANYPMSRAFLYAPKT